MSAETARNFFQTLEDQAHSILAVFNSQGYETVAPAIIQPAQIFLDVVGEDLRSRTYVFTDPEGAELCLRPDLTVPTCRLHWERHGRANAAGRYCYNGPAFRFQPGGDSTNHPREFRQAGIEHFSCTQYETAETEVLVLIIEALKAAGLTDFTIRIGDVGIFEALLNSLELPARWCRRLRAQFWRSRATFHAELEELSSRPAAVVDGLPQDLLRAIANAKRSAFEQIIEDYLVRNEIELIGARSPAEIAENLSAMIEDAASEPLADEKRELIENYLGVTAPARAAGARMRDLIQATGYDVSAPLDTYDRRLKNFAAAGIDLSQLHFSAHFGRRLEYYTGFVFEILANGFDADSPIAGGGRYDKLMHVVGATVDVPAVGAMIHTERLLSAVQGGSIE
ncbi:MAG: ATP phosphoribosyltransferase regulatory subunit [Pseudomonadota bacterium]